MKKLDQRGVAALEFCLVAVPLFTLMFVIFDVGRYAITMQSLRVLANAGARANMIKCYTPAIVNNTSPSTCTGDYLPDTDKQNIAPLLYGTGFNPNPTLVTNAQGTNLVIKASQPKFTMIMPIWGKALDAPSASTSISF